MTDPLLQLVLTLPLALLFFLAARHKFDEGAHFDAQLGAYRVLPEAMLPIVARLLPIIELAIAVLLVLQVTRTAAAFAAAALVTVYALGMLVNLLRGRTDIDCGCGSKPQEISYWLVLRNVILASAALLVAMPATPRPLGALDIALLALFAPLLSASYAMAGQLIANHSVLRHWRRNFG